VASLVALLLITVVGRAAGLLLQFAIRPHGDAGVSNPQAAPLLGGGSMPTSA